jgi:toxin ParE1/3/4
VNGDLIVRPSAEEDVRDAAFWYESKREGLGAEFTLEVDSLYERIAENPQQLFVAATPRHCT